MGAARLLAPLAAVASLAAAPAALAASPPPFETTVETQIRPQTERLLVQLLAEGRGMVVDGQPVFNGRDRFLPGKIAIGLAHLILETPRDDPRFARYVAGFRDAADLTLQDENEEWGIYYYILALHKLNRAGLLDEAVSPQTLAKLKTRLDWRRFVRPADLTLIDLPNNYYGVAFSIAQLRALLGWEDSRAADALLAKTLAHYRTFSDFGFADESEGQGRFDRYSVLLIAEIAARFIEAGREPPQEVRRWLAGSARLVLLRVGPEGQGFEYGRSLGPYGDTALVEVLTAAAYSGVLTPAERDVAYAFVSRVAQRYAQFWIDPQTRSVNLWDKGRRTDAYRGKHRILGENLSLARQFFYTNALWNELGYRGRPATADLKAWRRSQPTSTLTWFSRGDYDRALLTWRDGDRIFGLPLVNGAAGQHMNNPYYPIPYSPELLQGAADAQFPQLIFSYRLEDGSELRPLAYFRKVRWRAQGRGGVLTYEQPAFDRMGQAAPQADPRLSGRTRYDLRPGRIERADEVQVAQGAAVREVAFEFATFSSGAQLRRAGGGWRVAFAAGEVEALEVRGVSECVAQSEPGPPYQAPTGAFSTVIRCRAVPEGRKLRLGWRLDLRD
jgi:hypothetical protein